ncbi:phytoene desaturase family protein [Pseudonocardia sp. TRM90224]|uniref:phytoene desaturase family protein n=1 Tax=Pseudonocardia sp. TRM90224 TaxID=2812678 RepID=UPI001E4AB78A|nr:NAD(P)/FAD-dependent oxidoreductase [Pseudonocardia sp. TRM90224]
MTVQQVSGKVGLPMPITELAARRWDVVVVGGGHNGLTAAAYLARAGRSVLVLERREQLGGAATLERPFADERFVISPCAYVVGLLHPLVVDELGLRRHGFDLAMLDPSLWCPFPDGTSIALWSDAERTEAEVAALAPADVDGFRRYEALFERIRLALRTGPRDSWLGDSPDRAELAELLGHDQEALDVLLHRSIADVVEEHVADERLRALLHGQGVIGTWAGPRDPGTAAVHAMHSMGTLADGRWGYVRGGTGRVSFALADAAVEHGAVLASGVEVGAVEPGEGVRLAGGELIRAATVVSNADPKRTAALCAGELPAEWRSRVDAWRSSSPVVKINCGLRALPRFRAAPGSDHPYRAMVTITSGIEATQAAFEQAVAGRAAPSWAEVYFPSHYDRTVAPDGMHVMSVFAQYAPYELAGGSWATRREEIGDAAIAEVARFAPDIADCIVHREVLGPPDIEAGIGLTGGHIFQGDCLPDQMWDRRFAPRTPVPGLYLCGAATHPGGSVIGVNGRNAAMVVLADT